MEVRRALELACHALIACLTVISGEYLELVFMGAPAAPRKGVSLTNAPLPVLVLRLFVANKVGCGRRPRRVLHGKRILNSSEA